MANQSLDQNLRYVQVEADAAYIDSRVYCREIIEVAHKDWLNDTLRKYQDIIEELFGVVRFETAKPPEGSQGGRPEVYALLTESQCNFALTLSRNIGKTMRKKAELIADFEQAKTALRSQLNRQFNTSSQSTDKGFCYPLALHWKATGYTRLRYARNAIKRDFLENKHYAVIDGELMLTEITLAISVFASRSKRGVNADLMPDVSFTLKDYASYQNAIAQNKQNARLMQEIERDRETGQLNFFEQLGITII